MRILLVSLLLVSLSLAGCTSSAGGDGQDIDSDGTPGTPGDEGNQTDFPADAPTDSVSIAAVGTYPVNPSFDPLRFEVAAGTLLTVTFTNNDANFLGINHDLFISGVDAQTASIGRGASTEITFMVDLEPGEYEYWCTIGNHREQGMEGVMVVV